MAHGLSGAQAQHAPQTVTNNRTPALPVEILAMIFQYLPEHLLERLFVLHVSRTWRSAAFEGAWSCIRLWDSHCNGHRLVDLVLSNSRPHPVDFYYYSYRRQASPAAMARVVQKHLRRFRTIAWAAEPPFFNSWLCKEAPLLEHLSVKLPHFPPQSLLGGIPGRLHTLELEPLQLPASCPALATLRRLKASTPTDAADAGHLSRLFELCPNLQSLDLRVRCDTAPLPQGPAPRSLRSLCLSESGNTMSATSLIAVCVRWDILPIAHSVEINSFIPTDQDISPIMRGAIELCVDSPGNEHGPIKISVRCSRDQKRGLRILRNNDSGVASLLARCTPSLASVRKLTVTSTIFHMFCSAGGVLPSLLALHVVVQPTYRFSMPAGSRDALPGYVGTRTGYLHSFPWDHLAALPPFPLLASVDVEVRTTVEGALSVRGKTFLPTASDARELVAKLGVGLTSAHAIDAQVSIRGFPPAVWTGMDLLSTDALNVTFL